VRRKTITIYLNSATQTIAPLFESTRFNTYRVCLETSYLTTHSKAEKWTQLNQKNGLIICNKVLREMKLMYVTPLTQIS
jgi:hypothetical protein